MKYQLMELGACGVPLGHYPLKNAKAFTEYKKKDGAPMDRHKGEPLMYPCAVRTHWVALPEPHQHEYHHEFIYPRGDV